MDKTINISLQKYMPLNLAPDVYLDAIRNNKPFSFSRFGDGEVICMFPNGMQENCDGSKFFPELEEPMKSIFVHQYKYFHAFLNCTFWERGDHFRKFLADTCPNLPFVNGDIWQDMSFGGRITELIEVLDPHHPIFVGGEHLSRLSEMKGFSPFPGWMVKTASVNASLDMTKIMLDILVKYNAGSRMFCFSAGYITKIIIDLLFPIIGHDTFMIDFGSVFDPYCGKLSRDGMVSRGFEFFQPFTAMKLV